MPRGCLVDEIFMEPGLLRKLRYACPSSHAFPLGTALTSRLFDGPIIRAA
jgi:hypothetical protein